MIILTLYRVLWWLFLPGIIVMRLFKDWRSPLGIRDFGQRFALHKLERADLLVHAVSLGEVRAVTPLVKRLLADSPISKILFTSTTLTGSEQIQRSFKKELAAGQLIHTYLPLDFGPSIKRESAILPFLSLVLVSLIALLDVIRRSGARYATY